MDSGSQQLFMIAEDYEFRYCLHRVSKPENSKDESIISNLGEPVLKMNLTYPAGMSFVAVGTKIFMVGGYYARNSKKPFRVSNKTYIYDTLSGNFDSGPTLNAGKSHPHLLTIGTKIFALSDRIYCSDRKKSVIDCEPRFEVLDTEDLKSGWLPLPHPELCFSRKEYVHTVDACAAVYVCGGGNSSAIFIRVNGAGTYAFDVDQAVWNYVSDAALPFDQLAVPMPSSNNITSAPSLCWAFSSKSGRFSAFRFHYYHNEGDENSQVFQVDEITIDDSLIRSPPLPPEICYERISTVVDPAGRVYFITSGVDNYFARDTNEGNCYLKVEVCEFKCSDGQKWLRSCKKKKKKKTMKRKMEDDEKRDDIVKLDSNQGQVLKKCKKTKREGEDDEERDDIVKLHSNQGQVLLKKCKKTKREREDDEDEFKMSPLWRRCFFGGPMGGNLIYPIKAAFAM